MPGATKVKVIKKIHRKERNIKIKEERQSILIYQQVIWLFNHSHKIGNENRKNIFYFYLFLQNDFCSQFEVS